MARRAQRKVVGNVDGSRMVYFIQKTDAPLRKWIPDEPTGTSV